MSRKAFGVEMKKAMGDEKDATRLAQNLKDKGVRKVARNTDTIVTLIESLNQKPKFSKMVEYSVECLKNMAVDAVGAEELVENGVVETLEKILKLNPFNAKIQEAVNQCIISLVKNNALAADVGARLGAAPIVHALDKHVEVNVLTSTCLAGSALCMAESNVDALVKVNVLPVVEQVFQKHAEHVELAAAATGLLRKIAGHGEHAVAVVESGCLGRVLQAVKSFPHSAQLVKPAVQLASVICQSGPALVEKIKHMNGLDILITALESHPDDADMLRDGAACMALLSGADDLTALLTVEAGNSLATANAVSKLSAMMLVEDNVQYMVKSHGVEWLLAAIKAATGDHSTVAQNIIKFGCRAIKRICISPDLVYVVMKKGGMPILLGVIAKHLEDEIAACEALGAVTKMAVTRENAAYISKMGGVELAMKLFQEHPDSDRVQRAVLAFLQTIASYDESLVPSIIKAGGIDVAVNIIKRCGVLDSGIAIYAMGFITALANIAPQVLPKLMEAGAAESVISSLKANTTEIPLVLTVIQVLTLLAVPACLPELQKKGATAEVLSAMNLHSDNPDVQEEGTILVNLLGGMSPADAVVVVRELAAQLLKTPDNTAMMKKFVGALNTLNGMTLVPENVPGIAAAGGWLAFYEALTLAKGLSPSDSRDAIMQKCMEGLHRLVGEPGVEEAMLKENAITTALDISFDEKNNGRLALAAFQLATKVIADKPTNAQHLMRKNFLDKVVAAMQVHEGDESVLRAGINILRALRVDEPSIEAILYHGQIPQLCVDTLYCLDAGAVSDSLDLMYETLLPDLPAKAVAAYIGSEVIEGVVTALKRHGENEALAIKVVELCNKGIFTDPEVQKLLADKGVPLPMMKILKDHPQNEFMCEAVVCTLNALTLSETHVNALMGAGSVPILDNVRAMWPDNAPLQAASKSLLFTIRGPSEEDLAAIAAEKARLEAERLRKEEEERLAEEERLRLEEEARQAEIARLQREDDEHRAEAERRRLELERLRMEEQKRREEEERQRIEAERLRMEAERLRLEEEERKRKEDEERLRLLQAEEQAREIARLEEERQRAEEERRRIELERLRLEEERARQEEERRRAEEERIRQEEEERVRQEEERKRAEEERRKAEEERKKQEEEKRRQLERAKIDKVLFTTQPPTLEKARAQFMISKLGGTLEVGNAMMIVQAAGAYAPGSRLQATAASDSESASPRVMAIDLQLTDDEKVRMLANVYALVIPGPGADPTAIPHKANAANWINSNGMEALGKLMKETKNKEIRKAAAEVWAALAENDPQLVTEQILQDFESVFLQPDEDGEIVGGSRYALPASVTTKALNALSKTKLNDPKFTSAVNDKLVQNLTVCALDSDFALATAAVKSLAKISVQESGASAVSEAMKARKLIEAMNQHIDKAEFIRAGCYLLASMAAASEAAQNEIGEEGIKVLLRVCRVHMKDKVVVEQACYALSNMTFKHPKNAQLLASADGFATLLEVAHVHANEGDVLENVVRSVLNCSKDKPTKVRIIEAGVGTLLSDIILSHISNFDLVSISVSLYGSLALSKDNVVPMIRQGTVQSLVAAMSLYSKKEDIVRTSLKILGLLSTDATPEMQAIIASEGALQGAIDPLHSYPQNIPLLTSALTVLCNLCTLQSNADTLLKTQGMRLSVDCARANSSEPKLAELAMGLVAVVSLRAKALGVKPKSQLVDGVLELSSQFIPKDKIVANACLQVMTNFCWNEELAGFFRGKGACNLVSHNLETFDFLAGAGLLAPAYEAMSAFSRDEEACLQLVEPALNFLATALAEPEAVKFDPFLHAAMKFFADVTFFADPAEKVAKVPQAAALIKQVNAAIQRGEHDKILLIRALTGYENLSVGGKDLKQLLKAGGVVELCNMFIEKTLFPEVRETCIRIKENLGKLPTIVYRKINFDVDAEETQVNFTRDIRNFLIAGTLLMKWNESGHRQRHMRVSPDLDILFWHEPGDKGPPSEKHRAFVYNIRGVERGLVTARLRVKRLGTNLVDANKAFSINVRGKSIDLSCDTHALRERWVTALECLIVYTKTLRNNA